MDRAGVRSAPEFVGTCVGLPARHLDAYNDTARDISYETFRRHVGRDVIAEISAWYGYRRGGLLLKDDWHVRYSRGKWEGRPAVCMDHSSIHHLWLI